MRKFCRKLRKFRGNLQKLFCDDPFLNDPISELLIFTVADLKFWGICLVQISVGMAREGGGSAKKQRGRETQGRGKHTIMHLPKNGFDPLTYDTFSPRPSVHALSFSLEKTGTDQTNPSCRGLQDWFRSGHFKVRFPPSKSHDTFCFPPPLRIPQWLLSFQVVRSVGRACSQLWLSVNMLAIPSELLLKKSSSVQKYTQVLLRIPCPVLRGPLRNHF